MRPVSRTLFSIIVIFAIAAAIFYIESTKRKLTLPSAESENLDATALLTGLKTSSTAAVKEKKYPRAREVSTPDGFINISATSVAENLGKKVILIDFWTYSCINCQRTIPYLNAWYDAYREEGLEILAVHTPEFKFEEKYENVARAIKKFGIQYPVILDNDFSTWYAYRNQYWPRKYLIDIDGFVVYDHIGEGGYEETEAKIQELLKERRDVLNMEEKDEKTEMASARIENTLQANPFQSPEVYFGAWRNDYLASGSPRKSRQFTFSPISSDKTERNKLYLGGTWDIEDQYAQNSSNGARISFRYNAKNVYMVASADTPVRVRVLIDGEEVKEVGGEDVVSGVATIQEDRLYHVIEDQTGYGQHLLELVIEDPGLKVFTFTFGS